jgi:hypothetical protein
MSDVPRRTGAVARSRTDAVYAWTVRSKTVGTLFRTTTVEETLYPTKRTPFVEGGLGVSFRTTCGLLITIRSIVSPGKVSAHTHSVYGSTAFGPVVDARALAIADGTTCNIHRPNQYTGRLRCTIATL